MHHHSAPSRRTLLALALTLALTGAAILVLSGPAAAQQAAMPDAPAAADPEIVAAITRFNQAGPNNYDAINDAAERLTRLSSAQPGDPVLRAYAGAATAMRATTTLLPWRKMGHAEDGLALIDKALAQLTQAHDAPLHRGVPAVLETRFVAATTFMRMPSMFNRSDRGHKLLAEVQNSPLLASAPAGFKAAVDKAAQK